MIGTTDFNYIADQKGFLAVYPRGSGSADNDLSWNAGICCGYALAHRVDEPAFVRAMLADLNGIGRVDPKRTHATGFSNGAFLSHRLACEMSDTFAAVAPVGGALVFPECRPQQPAAVIPFHGRIDNSVPYEGGGTPIEAGFRRWRRRSKPGRGWTAAPQSRRWTSPARTSSIPPTRPAGPERRSSCTRSIVSGTVGR